MINFVPKDVQRILSSDQISEEYNEQKVFFKNVVLNNFALFTGKQLCWWYLFFNKNVFWQKAYNFIKKRLSRRCYFGNIVKFLRTPILKNICERLLLRGFPLMSQFERFSTRTNNKANYIGGKEDVLKTKTKRTTLKLSQMKKTWLFMMLLIISFFSISTLHVKRHLPYMMKDNSSEEL